MSSLNNSQSAMFNTLLNQGVKYLNLQKDLKYLVDPHLQLIEETTSPSLGSLSLENFSGNIKEGLSVGVSPTATKCNLPTNLTSPEDGALDLLACSVQYNELVKKWQTASSAALLRAKTSSDKATQMKNVDAARRINDKLLAFLTQMNKVVGSQLAVTQGVPGENTGRPTHETSSWAAVAAQDALYQLQRDEYDTQVNKLNTLMAENQDGKIKSRSAYLQYFAWGIVALTLIGYTTKLHL